MGVEGVELEQLDESCDSDSDEEWEVDAFTGSCWERVTSLASSCSILACE